MQMEIPIKDAEKNDHRDPGANRYGNFINYYSFHSAEERVQQLPRNVWRSSHPDRKFLGLDIGCNAGDLTLALHDFLEPLLTEDGGADLSLLGVDFDPVLIERACEKNYWPDHVTFKCLNFISDDRDKLLREYLCKHNRSHFDVAFCFSISMWIHINYGDFGLVEFLSGVCKFSNMVVIEPQRWKCYRNASRRLRRFNGEDFPLLDSLKYRGNMSEHIQNILKEYCNFQKVTVTGNNSWGREILIYERNTNIPVDAQ
ncbi:probable RNA methyltransferase CG11342 [Cephus cinctus]|uniref:RNA methyltransferase n=1 Tax=Cephus cinctus TaxID=211228 RepID=A0AAJ7R7Y0_CEPCN|nr:probable RNA methyltransferase CG11342 [Cephus cinctus]XP_024935565.1 probable RNA methyltransferase CG11342 [Cephus cinctus]XP_024935566.1 probable RNA methyltransferase CG11342 [Cephus cinctus]